MPRHLISDVELREIYERRLPKGPAFVSLSEGLKAEFRLFVETRGVLWNPRWGLTGRMNAYGMLREFTLREAVPEGLGTEEETEEEMKRRFAAKLAGKGPRKGGGGVALTSAEKEARAKILQLQKQWAALTEATEEEEEEEKEEQKQPIRQTRPGKAPGTYAIKKKNPKTGNWEWVDVHDLSPRKEAIIKEIQGVLLPLVRAKAISNLKRFPSYVADRIDPEDVAHKVISDWGDDVRLTEKEIADGTLNADASRIAGSHKTGPEYPGKYFKRYADVPADRPYGDIVQEIMDRVGKVIGSMYNRVKGDPTLGAASVTSTGARGGAEGEPVEKEIPAEKEEAPFEAEDRILARKEREPILKTIQGQLAAIDPEAAALFGAMIGTPTSAVAAKLGWDRRKFDSVLGRMRSRMRDYLKNPRTRAAILKMQENRRQYRPFLRMVFPGLFIPASDATYTTYRKFDLI